MLGAWILLDQHLGGAFRFSAGLWEGWVWVTGEWEVGGRVVVVVMCVVCLGVCLEIDSNLINDDDAFWWG